MSSTMMNLLDFYSTHTKLGKNDVILDVRNPDEFSEGHIKGAVNYPLPEIMNHAEELKKYDHVYIHCKRGGRAKNAFEALKNAGLTNLICVHDGGMDMWIENGFPIARG